MNRIRVAILCIGLLFSSLILAEGEIHIALSNSAYETVSAGRKEMRLLESEIDKLYPNNNFIYRKEFNAAGMRATSFFPDDVTLFDKFIEYVSNTENKAELQEILETSEVSARKLLMQAYLKLKEFAKEDLSAADGLKKANLFVTLLDYMGKTISAGGEEGAFTFGDTAKAVQEYGQILDDKNCLIVIAQGSGAFITNNARQGVASKILTDDHFQIIGVGPSTSKIEGNGGYVTLRQDVWGGEGWFNDALDFNASNEDILIEPNGIPVPALPFFSDYIENYLKEGTEGRRIFIDLIRSAIRDAQKACGEELKITQVVADGDDLAINTNTSFFNPGGTLYDIEVFYRGSPAFPITVMATLLPETRSFAGHCGSSVRGPQSCTVTKVIETPPPIPQQLSVVVDGFYCEGFARSEPIIQTFQYSITDANGVESNVFEHTHLCDFIF